MKRLLVFILITSMLCGALVSCMSANVEGEDETKQVSESATEATENGEGNASEDDPTEDVSTDEGEAQETEDEETEEDPVEDEEETEDEDQVDTEGDVESDVQTETADQDEKDTDKASETESKKETEKEPEKESEKETEKEPEKPTFDVKESTSGLKFELNPDGLSYTLIDRGTTASKSEILIDGHKGLPVTKIGYGVFDNSIRKDTKLTKVTIGDYVEVIDCYAFSHCSKLTTVVMGDNVKVINLGAFRYCSALTSINLGKSLEWIGDSAFYKSTKLATITMPSTVRYVADYAFDNTEYYNNSNNWVKNALYIGKCLIKLKSDSSGTVNVKDGTTAIADTALANCKSITKVVVPNSVQAIGMKAFKNCTALATLDLGSGIKYIGEEAFTNTKYYNTSSNWKSSILYAGSYLLEAKTSLSGAVSVATGTKAIAASAFASCEKISSVTLPASLVSIGEYAFLNCKALTSVTAGKNLNTIYAGAFKGCIKLTSIDLSDFSDWSVDGVLIDEDDLQTKSDAATLLTMLYAENVWTHK